MAAKDDQKRHRFTWILTLDKKKHKNIIVYVPESTGLAFRVELASHETCKRKYVENINMFLEESRTALPPLDVLGMYSQKTMAKLKSTFLSQTTPHLPL
jgi:hypothetical protein